MNKLLKLSFLLVIFSLCFAIVDADAQNYGKKKKKKKPAKTEKSKKSEKTDDYFDDSGNFASHLWYGGGLTLSYCSPTTRISFLGGGGICSPWFSNFTAGITPMVGYKIIGELSVGPALGIEYSHLKGFGSDGLNHTANSISWSAGVFARYKFLRTLFVHTEYGIESIDIPVDGNGLISVHPITNEVTSIRENFNNFYLGIGYSSGGDLIAFEIYLLNNFIKRYYDPVNSLNLTFRIGVTYKF